MRCPEEYREVVYVKNDSLYQITFLGRSIVDKNSVWCYRVVVTGDPALSFWILGLCIDPRHEVLKVLLDGEELVEEVDYELLLIKPDPLTELYGIKFQVEIGPDDPPVEFSFTLTGVFEIEPVDIGVKAGSPPALTGKKICGPSCEPSVPLRIKRGFSIQS